jgi:hypothetical protein
MKNSKNNNKTPTQSATTIQVPKQIKNGQLMPVVNAKPSTVEFRAMGEKPTVSAYRRLRMAWSNARYKGIREVRAKAAEEEEKNKTK